MKKFQIKGMAHITGGGFIENIPRMLPENCGAEIDNGSWPILAIFNVLQREGELLQEEMFNIFNMGIGMVLAVNEEDMIPIIRELEAQGEQPYIIGRVKEGTGVTIGGGSRA
jgi:phosphoribosylformylglycinamidine cyclo-ligase